VTVLLGNGHGAFSFRNDYKTAGANAVAIGDVNGDGKPDLVAPSGSGTISELVGNGDGSFGVTDDYYAGNGVDGVTIGDLNGDGKPDLVTANQGDGTVSVLLGTGGGNFGAATTFALPVIGGVRPMPTSVVIGDLDGDGRPDLALPDQNNPYLSVMLGTGGGNFSAAPVPPLRTGYMPYDVAIGDLNGDGKPDLVSANVTPNTVTVLLNQGGAFFGSVDYGTGNQPVAVAIADLNGDGKPDIVTANRYPNTVSVLLGNGNGTFGTKSDFGTGNTPVAVAIGDLNGDGKPDIVTANGFSNSVSVLLGNGNGTFKAKTDYTTGVDAVGVALGDLDGDGRLDIVTVNQSNCVSVLLGNGDGSFGPKFDYGTGLLPYSLAIADVNGDGRPDVVTANAGVVSVLLNTGATVAVEPTVAPTDFELSAPRPNPFRSQATFGFSVSRRGQVRLEIYDVQGRSVRTLQDGVLAPGRYERVWDGMTANGLVARTGVYLVRLSGPGIERTSKALLVR
jgi:hypothetical protein